MRRRLLISLCLTHALPLTAFAAESAPPAPAPAAEMKAPEVAKAAPATAPKVAGIQLWTLDPKHAEVGFTVDHMMVSKVRGAFTDLSGTLAWNEKQPMKSSVEATLQVASVDTRVAQRNDHLRSADFFDAAKFPTIRFTTSKLEKKGRGLVATGSLTIRDITRPITLQVKGPAVPMKDPMSGAWRTAISATGKINRKDFGLNWNKSLDKGGVLVGDTINIEISAEFIKQVD
jgi:polyisoprenoid-binding protein YceI